MARRALRAGLAVLGWAGLAAGAQVPRTPQAAQLARDVMTRVAKTYYSLRQAGAQGVQATFDVTVRGQPAGTLTASWRRGSTKVHATLDTSQEWQMAEVIRLSACGTLEDVCVPPAYEDGMVAARQGETIVVEYDPAKPEEPRQRYTFSADLTEMHRVHVAGRGAGKEGVDVGGKTLDVRWQLQQARGKLFLASVVDTMDAEGASARTTYTYRTWGPHIFVSRVATTMTVRGGRPLSFALAARDVTFGTAAADLAKDVIHKLNTAYYSLQDTDVKAFTATYAYTCDGAAVGDIEYRWERGERRVALLTEPADTAHKELLDRVDESLKCLVWQWEHAPSYLASRRGEDFVLTDTDVENWQMTVSADLTRVHWVMRVGDSCIERAWTGAVAGGRHFIRSHRTKGVMPSLQGATYELSETYTYTHQDGVVFLRRVRASIHEGRARHTALLELRNVRFTRGAAPPGGE